MAMSSLKADGIQQYYEILLQDPHELELLATDLLINVTSFFRDTSVFELLAEKIIPDLISKQPIDQPLRVWIAGCSTGEEAYSLAMLFREAITEAKREVKLQVFASDVDADAVATAREGLYPHTIETCISKERLTRFFVREDRGYRILPELRSVVIFTIQDVLVDPPFSRLDMVSCRNLLIYFGPEAQKKAISLFHFALREGGLLLLGNSETAGSIDGRFEVLAKQERLYRNIGRNRVGKLGLQVSSGENVRVPLRSGYAPAPSRQAALEELCRRLVIETYAPAAVLIDHKNECLYSLGPTDRYLRVAPGYSTHDIFALVSDDVRTILRSAIQRAGREHTRITVPASQKAADGSVLSFNISAQPVSSDGDEFLLISFLDSPRQASVDTPHQSSDVHVLEQELEITRAELQAALRNLEISSEEQKAINEEALSVNEEYQSTNEELLTSKEELQSLNEELTALNTQLQETLEAQRTTSDDLQNVLFSTDVATLFLDLNLHIRLYTPATKSLFNVIPGDIGRPLTDLNSLAHDAALSADARSVLSSLVPLDREIETQSGIWFLRRILPYRTHAGKVEGVVITFTDITERKTISKALEATKLQAEMANVAKSRFLASASHDLRQPLQTLVLLQSLLSRTVEGEKAQKLVARLEETIGAMSGMLNTMLDINQIEAGVVLAEFVTFPINDLLLRMRDEFTYHAREQRLELRVVPCTISINSDPHLLEQMIRNLLSNALKYTKRGKVLLGCRRRQGILSVEIWDTGVGIPEDELKAIFEEYHQLDNTARERARGLGLGLAIVQRLVRLLGYRVNVRSRLGKGSVFAIEIMIPPASVVTEPVLQLSHSAEHEPDPARPQTGTILVIEDDPDVRELLDVLLVGEGHHVQAVADGIAALELIAQGEFRPNLVLADYNLPRGMDGLQVTTKLRETLDEDIPMIILTGDISTPTLRDIARHDCVQFNKPVKLKEMMQEIERLLALSPKVTVSHSVPPQAVHSPSDRPVIYVVDDDLPIRELIREVLENDGRTVMDFESCEAFLKDYEPGTEDCLLIDAYLPGMSGLELLKKLREANYQLPAIMITGRADVGMAVKAMKEGAFDFLEKPIGRSVLLASIDRALDQSRHAHKLNAWREDAAHHVAGLTARQRQIMELVLAGHPSKNIAADLSISQRTVENHRAAIMKKMGVKSLPALARIAMAASDD